METRITGVYAITCLRNGRKYVGSSRTDIRERFYRHRYRLRAGKHHIAAMQLDWNEYGEDAFEFRVILACDPAKRFAAEQAAIDEAIGAGLSYNPSPTAETARGYKLTPDQRAAMSAGLTGRTVSDETRRKIGDANRANWAEREITPEVRERMAAMGRKGKGRPTPPEVREKMSAAQKGRQFSEEHRANLSVAKKGRKRTGEERAAISRGMLGHPCHNAKLDEDKVREIKRRLAIGGRGIGAALAAEFEISPAVISQIKTGQIWRNVA